MFQLPNTEIESRIKIGRSVITGVQVDLKSCFLLQNGGLFFFSLSAKSSLEYSLLILIKGMTGAPKPL